MIDIKLIREDPQAVKDNLKRRKSDVDIDQLLDLDGQWRDLSAQVDALRHERKTVSRKAGKDPSLRERAGELKKIIGETEKRIGQVASERNALMDRLPNFLAPDVPDGDSDEDNVEIRTWGEKPRFDFKPKQHFELGEALDLLDMKRGAKVAGANFYYWKGDGAKLAWALFHFAWDYLVKQSFTPFFTPCVARPDTLYGTGYLPFFSDEIYKLEGDDACLIGTSEQTLVGYHAKEILAADDLPLCYMAFTPCFRTEAGAHGRATRGIYRVHQFHKIEQIVFCRGDESEKWHDACQQNEEGMLQALNLPYRVVNVCTGDLGAPGWKKYDCEAWFAGYGSYREVTSNTNLTDYQARRLKIRFKGKEGTSFPHTISATGVTDRFVVALLENNQREDGTIAVPEALQPYMGGQAVIG